MCEGVTPTFDAGVVTDVVLARRSEPGPLASSMRPRRHSFEPSRSGQVTPREVASRTDLVTQLITSSIPVAACLDRVCERRRPWPVSAASVSWDPEQPAAP